MNSHTARVLAAEAMLRHTTDQQIREARRLTRQRFLARPGMPTPAELLEWIERLGVKAVAACCKVNERTLQNWYNSL